MSDEKPRHWITTIPVVAVISAAGFMAYHAGRATSAIEAQGAAFNAFAGEMRAERLEEIRRVRALEEWRIAHEAKADGAAVAVRRR